MNNNTFNNEIEINLTGVMWEILLRWKILIIIGILSGVVVAGIRYYVYPVSQSTVSKDGIEQNPDIRISQLETEMADDGREDDITTVNMLLFRSRLLYNVREICASSFIMQLDAYNTRKLTVTYELISDENISDLCSIQSITTSTDFLYLISDIDSINKDDAYLYTLVETNVDEDNSKEELHNALTVSVIITDTVDIVDAVDVITNYLYDYVLYNDRKVSELISISDYSVFEGYNDKIKEIQDTIIERYNSISTESAAIKTEMDKMSVEGKELLQLKLANKGINYDGTVYNSNDSSAVSDISVKKRSFSVKYFIIGLVSSIFVYICILFIKLIFDPKVGEASESTQLSLYPTFGHLIDKNYKRGNSFVFSPMVYKLIHRRDMETEINNIVSAMEYYSKAERKDMIIPVSVGSLSDISNELFEKVTDKWLAKYSVSLPVITLSVADKAELYEKISSIKGEVVLFLENNRTNLLDVENILKMFSEKNVKVIGKVMIG